MTSADLRLFQLDINGFRIATEARLVNADTFSGVFHVLSADTQPFAPPVVVLVPGKWKAAQDAHRAASDCATVMAADGSLQVAVELRLAFGH